MTMGRVQAPIRLTGARYAPVQFAVQVLHRGGENH